MSDRWGRVGFNDWMGAAQAISGFQRVNQRNNEHRQKQADQKLYQTALGGLAETGSIPEGTRPDIAIGAKQTHAAGLSADKAIADIKKESLIQERLNNLISWKQANPKKPWDDAPLNLYPGAEGMAAYSLAIDKETQTEQGKATLMKSRAARVRSAFEQFNDLRQYINTSMASGETKNAVNAIERLSEDLPIPYRVKGFNDDTQEFDIEYLDSHTGQHQKSEKILLKDVLQQIHNTGEKEFVGSMAQHMETVRQGNLEYRQNPIRGKGHNGREYLIIPQKKPQDPKRVDIEVRDAKTNEKIMFDSWESLNNAGIVREDLGRDKKLADINKSNQIDDSIKLTRQFKADLAFVLTPFAKPGLDMSAMFSGDDLTEPAKNALESAISFYERKSKDPSLSPQDKMKLQKAKDAIRLYNHMSQTVRNRYDLGEDADTATPTALGLLKGSLPKGLSSENTPQGEQGYQGPKYVDGEDAQAMDSQPPVAGARQAPDGNWYVPDPNRPGKYMRVFMGGMR